MRRRTLLTGLTAGPAAAGTAPALASAGHRVLHVRPGDSVQAAVDAVDGPGRIRFGQVHVVDNVHRGRAPLYALGVGVESAIFSERNVFRYPGAEPSLAVAAYGGAEFHDTGSWFNGRPARLDAVASALGLGNDIGWDPADVYAYRALTSPAAVERYVLRHAGAGRPRGRP
ncbi:hypothetical protein ACIP4Q_26535 [Streptomyces massasporeus]